MATSPVPAASPKSALLSAQASLLQSLQKLTLQQNYVPARLPEGKVVGIWGEAIVRLPDGEVRELKIGDMVRKGHVILTSQNGIVQLEVDGSRYARLPAREMLEAPAAGVSGGEDGSLSDSLRIARIAEVVSPAEYEYGFDGSDPYVPFGAVGDIAIGLPTLSVSAPSVREDAGQAVFTVSLSRTTDTATSISLALVNGSAQGGGVDYGSTGTNNLQVSLDGGQTWVDGASVTLPAGVASFLVRTPVVNDALREGDETFVLSATAVAGDVSPVPASGTATIVDDEAAPVIQPLPDQTVNEGAGTVTFTITLSGPSEQTISVDYRTVPGTALAGQDYSAITGTLTFAPGETTKTLTVPVIDDTVFEGAETFTLELSNPVNTSVSKPVTTVTIVDDGGGSVPPGVTPTDDTPHVRSVSSPTVAEGGNLDFQVVLSNASATPQVISVVPSSGTATLGTDTSAPLVSFDGGLTFTPITGTTVTVPAGSSSFIVRVPTVDDSISEPTETVLLDVRAPADAAPTTGIGTITDNDGTPTVSISGPAEVGENAGTVTYTITLSNPSSQTVTVRVAAQDGTATVGSDYTQIPADQQLVSFAPGETTRTVTLTVIDDAVFEGKETFSVVLDSPSQATLGTARVTTTISDDGTQGETDDRPRVAKISDAVAAEGSPLDFTVTLSNASTTPTNITLTSIGGNNELGKATIGTDTGPMEYSIDGGKTYNAVVSGVVSVPAGATSFLVRIPTINDTVYEGTETLTLQAKSPFDTAPVSGLGTITDVNDQPHVTDVTPLVNNATVEEGNPLDFTVTLSNASTTPTNITLTSIGGNNELGKATIGTDTGPMEYSIDGGKTYNAVVSGVVSVPAGATSFLVRIPTINDTVYEGTETLTLRAQSPFDTAPVSGLGTITDVNDQPHVTDVIVNNATVEEGNPLDFTVTLSNASTTPTNITLTSIGGNNELGKATIGTDTGPMEYSIDGGKTYNAVVSGVVSVPAGATSFLVRIPTINDTVYEGTETLTLRAQSPFDTAPVSGLGTITDVNDQPHVTDVIVNNATVEEGNPLDFTVTLSNASTTPTNITLTSIGGNNELGKATIGTDTGPMEYSIDGGKTYNAVVSGVVSVPAGATSFLVRIPTINDTVYEGTETLTLRAQSPFDTAPVSGLGTITDVNDQPHVTDVIVNNATVEEGNPLDFTVTLSNASTTPTNITLASIGGNNELGKATIGTDTGPMEYSIDGGKTYNAVISGVVSVPAGATSFLVRIPTINDTVYEGTETLTLRAQSPFDTAPVSGLGTITDVNDQPHVTDVIVNNATVEEGNPLDFTVTLSNASTTPTNITLTSIGGNNELGKATIGTDTGPMEYSIDGGKTYNAVVSGVVSVPAGATSFLVRIPTINDTVYEGTETLTLRAQSPFDTAPVSGLGTITDVNDQPHVTDVIVNNATVEEGNPLDFTVTLSNASTTPTNITLTSIGGNNELGKATIGTDTGPMEYSIDGGKTYNAVVSGVVSVPAGATSFLVRIPTINDTVYEGTETLTLRAQSPFDTAPVSGLGTITDVNDQPHVTDVIVNNATVEEGNPLDFTVTLSNASTTPTNITLTSIGGNNELGKATIGTDTGPMEYSIDGGKTYNAVVSGVVSVPAGATSFLVRIPTINDTVYEGTETLTLRAQSPFDTAPVSGLGTITDVNDQPHVTDVIVNNATVEEGNPLDFTVTLSNASTTPTNITLTSIGGNNELGKATIGTDTGPMEYSIDGGKTYNAVVSGVVSVPAGATSFLVRIPTINDTVYEGTETLTLRAQSPFDTAPVSGLGTITDVNDQPHVTDVIVNNATVEEGNPLDFTVTLSNASTTPTNITLASIGGNNELGKATIGTDTGPMEYSIDGGKTYNAVISGVVSVPAGATSFLVRIPTINDTVYEGTETLTLRAQSPFDTAPVSGLGTITDVNDQPHVTDVIVNNATVEEGNPLDFTVTLSNASTTPTNITLTSIGGNNELGKATIGTDTGPMEYSIDGGKTYNAVVSGVVSVPAGATSFLVRIPTINDTVYEGTETLTLRAQSPFDTAPVSGLGTITDVNDQPHVTDVIVNNATVEEGNPLDFTVTLSNASTTPTNITLASIGGNNELGKATIGTDTGPMEYSIDGGKTYNAVVSGVVSVPAGATSFLVRIPTINDTVYEGTETLTLRAQSPFDTAPVSGLGTITDVNDQPHVTDVIVNNATVEEGNPLDFTVTLSNASTTPTNITLASIGGNNELGKATIGTDTGPMEYSIDGGKTYNAVISGVVSVPAGATSFLVRIPTINDTVYEGTETLTLRAQSPFDTAPVSGLGTITDVNDQPHVTDVIVNNATVEEGNPLDFTVTLSNASTTPTNITLTSIGGNNELGKATIGTDTGPMEYSIDGGKTYNAVISGVVSVPAGATSFLVRIPTINDTVYEGTETLTLRAQSPFDTAPVSGLGTITDVNDQPHVTDVIVNNATVEEGNPLDFTVTLSNASTTPTNITLTSIGGNNELGKATIGTDTGPMEYSIDGGKTYNAVVSGVVSVPAGATSFLVRIPTINDTVYEGTETLTLRAQSPFDTAPVSGLGTITDVNDQPHVTDVIVNNATVEEGNPLDFTVTLSNASTTPTNITLTSIGGNNELGKATIGTDTGPMEYSIDGGKTYNAVVSGVVSVPAGATSFLVRIPTINDTVYEGTETLTLRAQSPFDTAPVSGLGTITDVSDLVFSGTLSEEGLSGGLADTTGATTGADTTNATTFTGTLALSSALTSAGLVLAWSATQAASLQSSATGTALTWTVSADGHTLTGSADGSTILTAVLNDTGAYSVTLSGPVRHAGSGEDTLSFNLGFTATQGSYSASGVATITVEDDAPATIADQSTSVTLQDTNLLITLDTSGSMLSTLTTGPLAGTTRLDAAIAAIKKLLDSYAEFGNVAVQLVTFSDSATTPSSTWMSVSAAKLLLENLTTGGNTNYDAALAAAQAAFSTSGRLTTGQNVAYFFSDGNPTAPENSIGVNATEEAAWASFLASQQMNAYAIGMTSDVSASRLDPIAWTTTGGTAASSIIVTDLNQLSGVLQSTVPIPTGDLVTGGEIRGGGQIGADGGFVQSVTIDGISYTLASASARQIVVTDKAGSSSTLPQDGTSTAIFNSTSKLLTVTTEAGGRFIIDMDDGTYEYRVPASVAAKVATEEMRYVVSDKDGDTASATVTVRVNDPSIVGTIGNDSLTGTGDATTPDYILGLSGNDTLSGLGGSDTLVGGTGSDWLTGGAGNDVFAWSLNDQGSKGAPAVDTITDFEIGADILDLRDLLVGEGFGAGNTAGNLANYLDFEVSGTTTTIHVSTTGAFTGGTYSAAAEDQTIVLQNVDLPSALGLTSGATDAQIISAMLTQGKLVVDPASGT